MKEQVSAAFEKQFGGAPELIVRAPGRSLSGVRCDALVESVDIFPTLLDLCDLPPLPVSDGTSFVPLLEAPEQDWKVAAHHVFNRNRGGLIVGHAVRTKQYRLVSWRRGWELSGEQVAVELYDYEQDPHETTNVADANPEVVQRLQALAEQARDDLGDALTKRQGKNVRQPGRLDKGK